MKKKTGAKLFAIFFILVLSVSGLASADFGKLSVSAKSSVFVELPVSSETSVYRKLPVLDKTFALLELPASDEPSVAAEPELSLYARSAVLMDADSGRVLYEQDGFTHMPNASTTKIMTCILAVESGRLEEAVTASAYAASQPKVHLGMRKEEQFRLLDLLYSLMLESHNDSAVAIAEHIGGSIEGFAEMMNEKAKAIGCMDTYFITPNGLDAQNSGGIHGTTARDLALIMSYCLKNETFLTITGTANYTFSNLAGTRQYACYNHNAFLTMMDGALTGKTGFTGNAGYCYVGALRQDNRTFVVALLACGWPNNRSCKWSDTKALMTYALNNYQYRDVFQHQKLLESIPVKNARPAGEKLYQSTYITPTIAETELNILMKESEQINVLYDIPTSLTAPLKAGTQIGTVSYYLEEQCIQTYPIRIKEAVQKLTINWYFHYVINRFFV